VPTRAAAPGSRRGGTPSGPGAPAPAPLGAPSAPAPSCSRSPGRYQASQPEFAKDLFAAANNDRG
jgi:hypothetical protein